MQRNARDKARDAIHLLALLFFGGGVLEMECNPQNSKSHREWDSEDTTAAVLLLNSSREDK